MKQRNITKALAAAFLLAGAVSVQAQTAFEKDVGTAIDRGIEWYATVNYFNNPAVDGYSGGAAGLVLLAVLEKRASGNPNDPPQGYAGASATDQARMRSLAAFIIDRSNENLGGDETYIAGNYLMGLARYMLSGGPGTGDVGMPPVDADYPTSIQAIKNLTDTLLANTNASGFFYYSTPPSGVSTQDSSATQFGIAGLASAKAVFSDPNPLYQDAARLALVNTALANGRAGYGTYASAAGSDNASCDVIDTFERGHGYRSSGYNPSLQQTASGTWVQILGGATVNDEMVQRYLRWWRNHYRWQDLDSMGNSWPGNSYWYYLWSSFKASEFIKESGIAPTPGNIGPDDIGLIGSAAGVDPTTGAYAACNVRQQHVAPNTVARVASFGPGGVGYYGDETPSVYFDYANRILGTQCYDGSTPINGTDGAFECNGAPSYWNRYTKQAYALLVLQRATGGACNDSDNDGVCDEVDNCPAKPNPNQEDKDNDGVGDVCDNCPSAPNSDQKDSNNNGIGDVCEESCDVDKDGDIDQTDLSLISRNRGKPVPSIYNTNGDTKVDPADVKFCIPQLTRP